MQVAGLTSLRSGVITVAIDVWYNGRAITALTLRPTASWFAAWSLGTLAISIIISLAVFFIRVRFDLPPSPIVLKLLPQKPIERVMCLVLCPLVGIVEEFLFRGFAFFTITDFVHSQPLVVALVTFSFALQHGIQDSLGVIRAFLLGGVLIAPIVATGSLLPSVTAHAAVDIFSGLYGVPLMDAFRRK
jgi:membrane protease YdiL (CAAX protease family)